MIFVKIEKILSFEKNRKILKHFFSIVHYICWIRVISVFIVNCKICTFNIQGELSSLNQGIIWVLTSNPCRKVGSPFSVYPRASTRSPLKDFIALVKFILLALQAAVNNFLPFFTPKTVKTIFVEKGLMEPTKKKQRSLIKASTYFSFG